MQIISLTAIVTLALLVTVDASPIPNVLTSRSETDLNPTRISGDGAHNTVSNSNYSGGTQIGNNILNGAFSNSFNGILAKPDSKTTTSTTTPKTTSDSPSTGSGGDTIEVNPTTVSGNDASNLVDNSNYSGGLQVGNNIGNGPGSNTGNNLASGLVSSTLGSGKGASPL